MISSVGESNATRPALGTCCGATVAGVISRSHSKSSPARVLSEIACLRRLSTSKIVSAGLKESWSVWILRLRLQQSSVCGKEQSNDDRASPADLVVPKGPNIDVIGNEIHHPVKPRRGVCWIDMTVSNSTSRWGKLWFRPNKLAKQDRDVGKEQIWNMIATQLWARRTA